MADAKVVNLAGGTDKTVILNVRAGVIQPFQAPNWVDLRFGFLLSLTKAAVDDDTTGLAETISGLTLPPEDRYWIGIKNSNNEQLPRTEGTQFIGFSNTFGGSIALDAGDSILSSSDLGVGTTNAYFWRPRNSDSNAHTAVITDGNVPRARVGGTPGVCAQHFPQNASGAGGYAVLLQVRVTRQDPTSKRVTAQVKIDTNSADTLFTNTPTDDVLLGGLEALPATVRTMGPVTLTAVPDALFLYWPFHNSRLRFHAMGILKAG